MAGVGEVDADTVLSDVEDEDPAPVIIKGPSQDDVSVGSFRELLAELDREKQAREVAESSKSELQSSFNRLKALAHEAIKKRDEISKQRDAALRDKDEALKLNEKVSGELAEAGRLRDDILKQRDEILKHKDEIAKQLEEVVKAKDSLRSEVETCAHMLVTGIDKLSGKVNNYKNFTAGGLPRSQKYTGLPAVAYGVVKRANEIVEELVNQIDSTAKSRNETREQMEHRNYEIAIEVSQLEAAISQLREDVSDKASTVENLEKSLAEKDARITEVEKDMLEKLNSSEKEASELKRLVDENDQKVKSVDMKMESLKPLLVDQLSFVSKIHDQMYQVIEILDVNKLDHSELSESMFLPRETDLEENVRATLAGMGSIYELTRLVVNKTRDIVDEKVHESKSLNGTVARLVKEKEHIGSLLRSALSKRITSNPASASDLFQVAENGLKESGIDFRFTDHLQDGEDSGSKEDEIYSLAGALENIVKASQLEIIELQHAVEELRAESSLLKQHLEAQTMELSHKKHQIEELEEKERVANESVEGLMLDIAAAEEEIARWKVAAEQEAAAGRAVEQEFTAQLSAIREELEEAKQALLEWEKKLRLKEETTAAALAARDAAEKSLRLADSRAARLRDRVEELTHQLEESDTREDGRRSRSAPRYICWPWQWLGLDFVGSNLPDTRQEQNSNEMELSEPLI